MSLEFIFWLLMLLWLFSWGAHTWGGPPFLWAGYAGSMLFFVLLFLLGWKTFGFPIHGA